MEAWPCQNLEFRLHEWLLAGWGMPIGELFDLEMLSEECRRRKRYTFFFSSVPLKVGRGHADMGITENMSLTELQVPGGVASPPNGVAIF